MEEITIDEHLLINADCHDVLMDLDKVDLILTDPPYGDKITGSNWDKAFSFNNELWSTLHNLIPDNRSVVLFGNNPFSASVILSNISYYKYSWVWVKHRFSNMLNVKCRPGNIVEDIMVFSKGPAASGAKNNMLYNPQELVRIDKKRVTNNNKGGAIVNLKKPNKSLTAGKVYVQKYTNYPSQLLNFRACYGALHPTQKPIDLLEYLINTYTNMGDTVLDFTMGVGSTGVACVNTGRKFIGIEKSNNYYRVAKARIKSAKEYVSNTWESYYDDKEGVNKNKEKAGIDFNHKLCGST